jgi:hypothetical protein
MKACFWLLVALLGLLAPVHAQELGDVVSAPGQFSYQAPKTWKVTDSVASKYKLAMDAPKNGFAANINVVIEPYPKPLAEYVELNKQQITTAPIFQNVKVIDEQPFTTVSGLQGTRLTISDTMGKLDLQQVFYFFAGQGDTKLVVTCSSLVGDGAQFAPIFDASLKSFTLP